MNHRRLLLAAALAGLSTPLFAAPITWSGASGTDINWNTDGNWSGNIKPTSGDDAVFDDATKGATAATLTNTVDNDYTITNFNFAWRSPVVSFNHLTEIAAGKTLLATGGWNVANGSDGTTSASVNVAIRGADANSVFQVGNTGANTATVRLVNNDDSATSDNLITGRIDLSGLNTFRANVDTFYVGVGSRPMDVIVTLAANNIIDANTLTVGNASGNSNAKVSILKLGQVNTFHASTINIGQNKGWGTLNFAGLPSSTLEVRNTAGTGRAAFRVGYNDNSNTGVTSTGVVDWTGGSVDALLGTFTIGSKRGTGTGDGVGTVTFNNGTIDATTIILADSTSSTVAGGDTTGTFNIQGGSVVATTVTLGNRAGAGAATANLNLSGGTLRATNLNRGSNTPTANFTWTGGTLSVASSNLPAVNQNGPASILSPGLATVATSSFGGDYALTSGSWNIDITGAGTSDVVNVTGLLDLSGINDALNISVVSGTVTDQPFIIATYGSLLGTFNNTDLSALPAGYEVIYDYNGNSIAIAVPEPGALGLIAMAIMPLLRRRRR